MFDLQSLLSLDLFPFIHLTVFGSGIAFYFGVDFDVEYGFDLRAEIYLLILLRYYYF